MGNPKDLDPKNLRPRTRSMNLFSLTHTCYFLSSESIYILYCLVVDCVLFTHVALSGNSETSQCNVLFDWSIASMGGLFPLMFRRYSVLFIYICI